MLAVKNHIQLFLDMITKHRQEAKTTFKTIFEKSTNDAKSLSITLEKPRIAHRKQTQRSNHAVNSTEDFFRVSLFIPYLDSLISSLGVKFSEDNNPGMLLYNIHPKNIIKLTEEDIAKIIEIINNLYKITNLKEQASLWLYYWKNQTNLDVEDISMIELLDHCLFYPAIAQAIEMSLCLPPTTCTIERSFSTLRRVKTWIRSTISEQRLDGLCMMSVHRNKIENNRNNFIKKVRYHGEMEENPKKRKSYGRMTDAAKKLRLCSHELGPDCKCKRLNCFVNVSYENKLRILRDFNDNYSTYDEQNTYLAGLITVVPVKRRHAKNPESGVKKFNDASYSFKV
ncbi:unnamed protein product [Diabrotica balteata]|uniref:HAT C-terminal dimerisation domain-containing protein n=1 Tax=Diabrotica balteata TaxID=107213 RepID=A0A9N9X7X5_DIABA|nr:unnamed protein product [Diabrotica balteata]